MDKYEYKVRADEIKQLIAQKEYVQAAEIADTIDWRRVKSVMMLCTVSDLYKINRRYEDARDMLLLAYERRPGGRTICYSLCELSIKMEEFVQAVEYYKEFVQVAPKDPGRYVLQYKLYEAQDVSLEERIDVLEELKKRDYREKWAYELAYLYHRIGLATRCVEECDELILWFGSGKYVIKAMELKMLHQPLSPDQQEKYDHRFDDMYGEQFAAQPVEAPPEQAVEPVQSPITDEMVISEEVFIGGDTQVYEAVRPDTFKQPLPDAAEDMDIHVKTVDVGEYNTINLQAELAEGLREVLGGEEQTGITNNPITNAIVAPMLQGDTGVISVPQEAYETETEYMQDEEVEAEVFFGATGEISNVQQEDRLISEQPVEQDFAVEEPANEEFIEEAYMADESFIDESISTVEDVTAEIVMEQMRLDTVESKEDQILVAQPPKELAGVLSQESDGQIRLVMPESENLEKQITGQMSIEDILAEWERMKKENEEKRKEDVRQHVLEQTGSMFTEFEASVRDGLLEQLENGEIELEEAIEDAEAELAESEMRQIDTPKAPVEAVVGIAGAVFAAGVLQDAPEEFVEATEVVEAELVEAAVIEGVVEPEITEEAEMIQEEIEAEILEDEVEELEEIVEATQEVESVSEFVECEPVEREAVEAEFVETEIAEDARVIDEVEPQFIEPEITEEAEIIQEEIEAEILEDEVEKLEEIVEATQEVESVSEFVECEPAEMEAVEAEKPDSVEGETKAAEAVADEVESEPKVEREPAKLRALTREEKELYAPYIQSRASKEQLIKAVDNISMAAYTGNIIITGVEGTDTLGLAKNMIREVQIADSNFSGKVAKISGKSLNNRDVDATIAQLKNGALIIERASALNTDTVQALHKCMQQESLGIIIVLEDNKKSMERFLTKHEQFGEAFTSRVDIEVLSNDVLVAYGKQYAKQMEYAIDDLGVLALHTRIEELQTIDHAVTTLDVKEIVDEAIAHVKRKSIGHFLDVLFAKRYDEEDMIILTEKDFV